MKITTQSRLRTVLIASIFVLLTSAITLFKSPVVAQVVRQIAPRIETSAGNDPTVPPSYRLVVSRPQDIVYVTCPNNYAPKLGYLRNVEAIQCERFQSK
ncbi:hypothetical protein [Microseira sp. BLCC-F43]|uniref:hypothetical protein n=1 Tax=Microseira sp. BLCC-F43 TaxID=3153602 RepID=UPI0035B8791F